MAECSYNYELKLEEDKIKKREQNRRWLEKKKNSDNYDEYVKKQREASKRHRLKKKMAKEYGDDLEFDKTVKKRIDFLAEVLESKKNQVEELREKLEKIEEEKIKIEGKIFSLKRL